MSEILGRTKTDLIGPKPVWSDKNISSGKELSLRMIVDGMISWRFDLSKIWLDMNWCNKSNDTLTHSIVLAAVPSPETWLKLCFHFPIKSTFQDHLRWILYLGYQPWEADLDYTDPFIFSVPNTNRKNQWYSTIQFKITAGTLRDRKKIFEISENFLTISYIIYSEYKI